MTTPHRFSRLLFLLACAATAPLAGAATLTWNTPAAGNTWDFNTTADWNNGSGAVKWTSNGDLANIALNALNSTSINIDDSAGQVGAYGITFSGTSGSGTRLVTLGGTGPLQLGAGGLVDNLASTSNQLIVSTAVQLTASQVWAMSINSGFFTVSGALSSVSGPTNMTFDTRGAGSAAVITLQGANTYSGTATVRGGGTLALDYTTNDNSKIDSSSALILAGGTLKLVPNGSTAYTQAVASTLVTAGANEVTRGGSSGTNANIGIQLGAISRNTGATLDVTLGSGNAPIQTDSHNDATGILGGWATFGGTAWAVSAATGTNIAIGAAANSAGMTNRSSSSLWGGATENVNDNAGTGTSENNIASHTINTLRINSANVGVGLASGATLDLAGGGLLAASTGQSVTGGSITSGMSSGELFVHTPNSNAFTLGSAVVDNGATAVSLVKDGASTLTLTGASTYTGTTYVNAGTVAIGAGGSIASSGRVVVMAGATFDSSAIGGHTVGAGKILSGGGTVLGNVVVSSGGRIAPAVSYADASGAAQLETGVLKFGNNLTLQDGSALTFNLGTNSDLLSLTNAAATLTGSASTGGITLNLADAGGVAVGSTYTLIQWASGTTLSSFDQTDFAVNGLSGTLNLDTVNDKLTFTVSAVPEPSALAFLALGLVGLAAVVRRNHLGKAAA